MNATTSFVSHDMSFEGYLPDKRLAPRALALHNSIHSAGSSIVHQISSCRTDFIGYLRFLNNERVLADCLSKAVVNHSVSQVSCPHVLAIADTTEVNFRRHEDLIEIGSLGPVGNNVDPGFFIQPTLLVDPILQLPLGFGDVQYWIRDYGKSDKHQRDYPSLPIEEKESFNWIKSALKTRERLPRECQMTFIGDRGADIYELFARAPREGCDLIIRCQHDRCLLDEPVRKLFDLLNSLPVMGQYSFNVKNRWKKKRKLRSKHEALMEVKYTTVRLQRSKNLMGEAPPFVDLYLVEATENPLTVPQGEEPIHWKLFTTHKVTNLESAIQIVEWYGQRWHIEQIFRILKKQGLQIESSRLHQGESLIKLAIMSLIPSVKILQLSLAKDSPGNPPATVVFKPKEILYLWLLKEKYEGKTLAQKNPYKPESLAWAAWTIARLGGWKGYEKSAKAGPITIKRGLDKFEVMMMAWEILEHDQDV